MAPTPDPRLPVTLLEGPAALAAALAAGPPAAVLAPEGLALPPGAAAEARFAPAARHFAACACCQGRSPAAQALDRLFQARARGRVPWFERVLALGAEAPLREALAGDALTMARFRQA